MRAPVKRALVGAAIAAAASAALFAAIHLALAGRETLAVRPFGREVTFLEPAWLELAAVIPFVFWALGVSLSDLSRPQQILVGTVRSLLFVGAAVALARPSTVTDATKIATVVLVDVSDSVSDKQLAAAQTYVDAAWRARAADDAMYVVSFAERPVLVPANDSAAPRVTRHAGHGAGTDIQAALQLAYGLYPPGTLPRAVILSDGIQTDGDLLAEAYKAKDFGVKVSWNTFPEDPHQEIRAVAVHLPDGIKVGAPFSAVAEVWSTHEEEVTLALYQDDFPNGLEPQKTVTLHEGQNRIPFKTEAKGSGFVTYTLRIRDPKHDENKLNNVTVASAPVKGRPRILYIEGEADRDPSVATYLKRALDRENIDVEVRGPRGAPGSAKDLEKFDLVLLSDLSAVFLGSSQMTAIEGYVRDMGGGFIMAGGQDSFGSGGYQGTRIEKILPVRFDSEKELNQPSVALVLVIDRSGSMQGEKLEMAKESARATAEVLDPSDLLSVIAFDNTPMTIVRLQRASNRLRISTDIAKLHPGGGTNILPALQEAFSVLGPVNAKVKHVILLTDGQAAAEGIPELVDDMRQSRITVSCVGIGDADKNMLAMISEHGEGKLYMAENASELPKIFVKETSEVQKSSLVEDLVTVHVVKRVEMIEGTGVEESPPLRGYVTTKPKDTAEVILVSDRAEPLLARWRVGLGQVIAWTSDVKNRWAKAWLTWPGYAKFWAQVVRTTMRHRQYESYDLRAEVVSGRARVVVDAVGPDDRFVNAMDTTLEIVDPRDSKVKRSLPMNQTAAGRYEAEFPVDRYGTYLLKAVHKRDGRVVAESLGAVALPYPAEYLRATPDPEPLRQAALVTGGVSGPSPAQLFARTGEKIETHRELWPFVLLAVACLFLCDVYLRRVRLFGYRPLKF